LLLIGDGPEETSLKRLARDLALRNFVMVDFVQQIELPPYYCASHVFIFPTLGDPYGIALDEAMTCGLPVISTSEAGEIRERVEDGVTGFLVPPKDVNALAGKMRIFVDDSRLIVKMGQKAKERVKGHTPAKWAEGMVEMYRFMLNE
jgi:glycosyltransferase involved in cell wall biosynthesis